MFAIKQATDTLTGPGTIVLLMLCFGFLRMMLSRPSKKKGWVLIGGGLVCFYLFTTTPLPNYLTQTLESLYEPFTTAQNYPELKYIVVLSGGSRFNDQVPPTSQLKIASALRVAEGIRLFQLLSGSPVIIMSGGWGEGAKMVAFARDLGVPPKKLISETQSRDTYGNAIGIRELIRDKPFLLVTSATHMPRAMRVFQILGMKPIAAPGDYRHSRHYSVSDFFPSGDNLTAMEAVIHEYLGLAYLYLFPSRAGE